VRLLCVCPNPALDHTVVVDHIEAGETTRASKSATSAGGKGLNVARFAVGFGVATQSATCAGELGAEHLDALARRDSLNLTASLVPGAALRICPIVVSSRDRSVLSTSDPPPVVDPASWTRFTELVVRLGREATVVCVSGSCPIVEGLNPIASLLKALASHPRVWVDTSGNALVTVVREFPDAALKVNLAEAQESIAELGSMLDRGIHDHAESVQHRALFACQVLSRNNRDVVVTAGRHGAAEMLNGELRWLPSPTVETRNPTASGDAFLAGYVSAGTGRLSELTDPLVAGLCAGAANAGFWYPNAPAETVIELASAPAGAQRC